VNVLVDECVPKPLLKRLRGHTLGASGTGSHSARRIPGTGDSIRGVNSMSRGTQAGAIGVLARGQRSSGGDMAATDIVPWCFSRRSGSLGHTADVRLRRQRLL